MILKDKKNNLTTKLSFKNAIASASVLIVISLIFFSYLNRKSPRFRNLFKQQEEIKPLETFFSQSKYFIKSKLISAQRVDLHIKQKNLYQLQYDREQKLNGKKKFHYVSSEIQVDNKKMKAKIRLKGDRNLHIAHPEKWSFRVKIKGEQSVLGMKRFSLQRPLLRNFIWEWIFHQALKDNNLFSLRYSFVDLYLNGKPLGIYALEEHFDKRLVENTKHLEGPILKFLEGNTHPPLMIKMPITAFSESRWTATPEKKAMLEASIALLRDFTEKKKSVAQTFDLQKMADFFALVDVFGTHHASVTKSIRFYFNPVVQKFEPIGFDGHFGKPSPPYKLAPRRYFYLINSGIAYNPYCWQYTYGDWYKLFFDDESLNHEFLEAYGRSLKKFTKGDYLERFFTKIEKELEHNLTIIHQNFPLWKDDVFNEGNKLFNFSPTELKKRRDYIRKLFNNSIILSSYLSNKKLEIFNHQQLPIFLESISLNFADGKKKKVFLKTYMRSRSGNEKRLELYKRSFPLNFNEATVTRSTLNFRIPGELRLRQVDVFLRGHRKKPSDLFFPLEQKPNLKDFSFIKFKDNIAIIEEGRWDIKTPIIFPKGAVLKIKAGVTLNLLKSSFLLLQGPIQALGTEKKPILITSSDHSAQGVAVLNSKAESLIQYTTFSNLKSPHVKNWMLSSSVTFYESDVQIANSSFDNNKAEDFLNVKRSKFKITESSFSNVLSDAIDSDYSDGEIKDSNFIAVGNDAVDVSGNAVSLHNLRIEKSGDKAISAGEGSLITANQITISDVEIALASKDSSKITGKNFFITNSKIGITAYNKKPEFSGGVVDVKEIDIKGSHIDFLPEKRSKIVVDSQVIPASPVRVKTILYGEEYGKSSK